MIETSIHRGRSPALLVHALGVTAIATAAVFGCAKPPTMILTEISADPAVPPLLVLQYSVTRASDPGRPATASVVSQAPGDAGDGRAAFVFPMILPVGPLAGWSGPVEITIDGRDWVTDKIVATGKTTARAVPQQQTTAALTLTAVASPGDPDAGTGGDAGSEAAGDTGDDAPSDATSDAASDS